MLHLGGCATPGGLCYTWGAVLHLGGCATPGGLCYTWGAVLHLGGCATPGWLCYTWGAVLHLGGLCYTWGAVLHLGGLCYTWGAMLHLEGCATPGGAVLHPGGCVTPGGLCYTWGAVPHLQRRHKLDGADESERRALLKVVADSVEEVQRVDLNVDEHVQHLNTAGGVDRNYKHDGKCTKWCLTHVRRSNYRQINIVMPMKVW